MLQTWHEGDVTEQHVPQAPALRRLPPACSARLSSLRWSLTRPLRPPPPSPLDLQIMFVLVALSLTLCFIALMYLLFKKNQSFKEALSFTIVLLVRVCAACAQRSVASGRGAYDRRQPDGARAGCGNRPARTPSSTDLPPPSPTLFPANPPPCRSHPSPLPLRLCAPPPWLWAPASCRPTAPL